MNNTLSSGYDSIQNINERNLSFSSSQSANQSVNQSINQSFNQSTSLIDNIDNMSMVTQLGDASFMEMLPEQQLPFFPPSNSSFYGSSGSFENESFSRSFEQNLVNSFNSKF